ncbi:MAG: hypothetical protein KKH01_01270 [Firmicutes bacterium]|nr:hypothetical protein [Bacillota bacterium]
MSDKYTKVEPKIHPITIIAIVSFFVVVLAIIFIFKPSDQTVIYKAYEPYATSDFTEDHPFVTVAYDSKLFNKGLDKILSEDEIVILYIGYPTCPSCQAHIGAFEKYFYSEGFDAYANQIYYMDPNDDLDSVNLVIENYPDVEATTPQLLVFQNGELISIFTPLSSEDATAINRSVRDFYLDAIDLINAE